MSGYNDRVIDEFRANGGRVQGFGTGLVLVHSTGARSGEPRINPVAAMRDGDGWLICASLAGAPINPAWYFNLVAHPEASIETPDGAVDVTAVELTDDGEYDAAFGRFVARYPAFADYATKAAPRRMPLIRLVRRA
ncbi:nitroreductase/quinone reductase family protein [Jatrophihabitans endophyticus]|uniref:nitroreductase/quinone reductase family protein n=1 Tax=Jatrophihabitans endophyticus TaxID=1206085 RepID=UPI0019F23EEF|nr:nitroreductase/quinone reductase family protein [Jatrophihabitans endophyticus]MBE7190457.1 nitroreductase family deazaflavin-dependent oxidoreductase [Jatrophihabitans endophyticus]